MAEIHGEWQGSCAGRVRKLDLCDELRSEPSVEQLQDVTASPPFHVESSESSEAFLRNVNKFLS